MYAVAERYALALGAVLPRTAATRAAGFNGYCFHETGVIELDPDARDLTDLAAHELAHLRHHAHDDHHARFTAELRAALARELETTR